jgi:hypothetical protein
VPSHGRFATIGYGINYGLYFNVRNGGRLLGPEDWQGIDA